MPLLVGVWFALSVVTVVACGGSDDAVADAEDGSAAGADGGETSSGDEGGTTPADASSSPADGGADGDADTDADAGDGGPKPIVTSTFVSTISANEDLVCAITKAGELRCWGTSRASTVLGAGSTWKGVSAGGLRGTNDVTLCAIRSDDSLWCWANGTDAAPSQPDASTFKQVSLATLDRCAIASTGALYCWGTNSVGTLGVADGNSHASPTQVGVDTDWKLVAPGNTHTCAIKNGGALSCWGWNAFGEVGDGSPGMQRNTPVAVDVASTYIDVSVKAQASCGVRSDGSLMCWGTSGSLGLASKSTPFAVDNAKDWAKVRLSPTHACAVKTTGALYCWGSNDRGQLAIPIAAGNLQRTTPQRIGLDTDWADIAVGSGFSCATKTTGTVWCWGTNGRGQLALDPPAHLQPKRIGAAGEWATAAAGPNNVCAVRKNGTLACWGLAGALPTAGVSLETPATIGAAADWKTAKPASTLACATKTNDALHCWNNGTTPATTGLVVTSYDVGYEHQCAVAAGSLYCWGGGIFGKLGNGSSTGIVAPTKVGTDTWTRVGLSAQSTCGTKADGTLVCFGFGYPGFEKQGNATAWSALEGSPLSETYFGLQGTSLHRWDFATATPVASGAENDWLAIGVGDQHVCGIRTGGTLWCKGENERGQLGDGTLVKSANAVQVGIATDWTSVTAAGSATCGIRGGGDLYCWGSNDYGEIGDGTAFHGSPTVVP
jgi:alpha-tubulin suppressor-like RCC1 family protein